VKKLFAKAWSHSSVKAAFWAGTLGLAVLMVICTSSCPVIPIGVPYLSAIHPTFLFVLSDAFLPKEHLARFFLLTNVFYFVQHLPTFVLIPSLVVGFAVSLFERAKRKLGS
jgi:hypothetical protein